MSIRARRGTSADLERIYAIWEGGIENSLGGRPPAGVDYKAYYRARLEESNEVFPFFVVEKDNVVVSWTSLTPFRANPAVRDCMAEISVYTDPAFWGQPVTTPAVDMLFDHADACPELQFLIAFIATTNAKAVGLASMYGLIKMYELQPNTKAPGNPPLNLYLYRCGEGQRKR
ncbi:MAG: GNAT family N-acetyltransferase [Sandaracinaceae bacterium]|jgi:L-amino acid N-acyltransferase YncA|nr:GNAT family N-acetyltransferase [Sandaracinaceae bacterium]